MKYNESKYINFIKELQQLMNNNILIDISTLIKIIKNNLYEIGKYILCVVFLNHFFFSFLKKYIY